MPYDEQLADRVRRVLASRRDVEEKAMFGGLAFMVRGYMTVGLVGDTLMVRVGPDDYVALLDEPHVRPMDFTGRPLTGFVYVDPPGLETASALRGWVDRAIRFNARQPEKPRVKKPGGRGRRR
jgi:TfoX/Sxy family transcriptional regulator of competence genes